MPLAFSTPCQRPCRESSFLAGWPAPHRDRDPPFPRRRPCGPRSDSALSLPSAAAATPSVPERIDPEAPILAGPIAADSYVLGPGDVLNLILPGVLDGGNLLVVDAEGGLILPGRWDGSPVAGLTLAAAREEVGRALAALVRNGPSP